MSTLTYRGIILKIVDTVRNSRKVIYDATGLNYLRTRFEIHVRCVFDPGETSYIPSPGGQLGAAPAFEPRWNANITDRAIRTFLQQPRGKLIYRVGEYDNNNAANTQVRDRDGDLQPSDIIESPLPGYTCDAAGGPFVIYCDVVKVVGDTFFQVEFHAVTEVNEWARFAEKPPILLSNTWDCTQDVDKYGFARKTVNGEAVFRRDTLEAYGYVPDDFRRVLLMPIPLAFKRENLRINQVGDGYTLQYSFADQEKSHTTPFSNVMEVEAGYSVGTSYIGMGDVILGTAKLAMRSALVGASLANPVNDVLNTTQIAGQVGDIASAWVDYIVRSLPVTVVTMFCRVWGNKSSSLNTLTNFAHQVVFARYRRAFGPLAFIGRNPFSIRDNGDWAGRFVETNLVVEMNGILGSIEILTNILKNAAANLKPPKIEQNGVQFAFDEVFFPSLLETDTKDSDGFIWLNGSPDAPAMFFGGPDDKGGGLFYRGPQFLKSVFAQALLNSVADPPVRAGAVVADVPDPDNFEAQDLTY